MKIGMYVRCPYDELTSNARMFIMGQIIEIDEINNSVTVKFHDHLKLRSLFISLPKTITLPTKLISRVSALENSLVLFKGVRVRLLSISKIGTKDEFYRYFVEYFKDGKAVVEEVSEEQIEVPLTRAEYNPVYQMLRYEFQYPQWYLSR